MKFDFIAIAIFEDENGIRDEYIRYSKAKNPAEKETQLKKAEEWVRRQGSLGAKFISGECPSHLSDDDAKIYITASSLVDKMVNNA